MEEKRLAAEFEQWLARPTPEPGGRYRDTNPGGRLPVQFVHDPKPPFPLPPPKPSPLDAISPTTESKRV